jgi:hypothetical protein
MEDGTVVAYERDTNSFLILANPPRTVSMNEPIDSSSAFLIEIGPDEVAYIASARIGAEDPIGDVIAVSLAGSNAGQVVGRGTGGFDYSGDSTLVPTNAGIVTVGCCGFDGVIPDPTTTPVIGWVDRAGVAMTLSRPQVSFERSGDALTLARSDGATSQRWPMPQFVRGFRDIPSTAVRSDGSVIVLVDDWIAQKQDLLVFKTSGTIEHIAIADDRSVALVDDAGAITYDGSRFARWSLPTFTDPLDAMGQAPRWLGSQTSFASSQALLETVIATLTGDDGCETPPTATVTTADGIDPVVAAIESRSGCDDSGGGSNIVLTLASDDAGNWSVIDATQRFLCIRGGGPEACV